MWTPPAVTFTTPARGQAALARAILLPLAFETPGKVGYPEGTPLPQYTATLNIRARNVQTARVYPMAGGGLYRLSGG